MKTPSVRAILAVAVLLSAPVAAQAPAPSGASSVKSTELMSPEIQAAIKRGIAALTPGATVNDRLVTLSDMGKYNVAVAAVVRPAGKDPRALSHDKITEVYYILRGSGTQLTGTLVGGTHQDTSKTIGPGMSSDQALQNPKRVKLGPGDIQIIPPGMGHAWESVDAGGVDYLVFRIDPEHVLEMPK